MGSDSRSGNAGLIEEYLSAQSRSQPFDPRIAILMLTVYSVGIFFIESWYGMAVFAMLFLIPAIFLCAKGLNLLDVLKYGIPVYAIVAITVVFNAIQPSASPESYSGSAFGFLSWEGVARGAFFGIRIILVAWASLSLCLSVRLDSIEASIASILSPLRRLGVPVDDISVACSIAIRFIPLSFRKYREIRDSQWSRGAKFDEGPIAARIKGHLSVFAPMFVSLFQSADKLSEAMESRCYGMSGDGRTDIRSTRSEAVQIVCAFLFCALCIATAVML